ncbi:MAG TPA: sigma-E factor regulatory protein RseB domain-containing protein [Mycobacteriales bacterium]|nr:sigma-E factor regulatory protein RseB domain-containing protein [Mycobacteriales bacterium]
MKALRLAAALTGLGALLACPTARASFPLEPTSDDVPVAHRTSGALALLESAAAAAQARTWTGTERVLSLVTGAPVVSVATSNHGPGAHSATDALDARLFSLLAQHYELRVTGSAWCAGHLTRVVEAVRTGVTRRVAARFWLDRGSGLLLRRDVMDRKGALLRRNELLSMTSGLVSTSAPSAPPSARGRHLEDAALARLERAGWPVLRALPGHLDLYEARWLPDGALQLAYSDGLSTLSLFVQPGQREPVAAGVVRRVGGGSVWEAPGDPERAVWSAEGRTWTLVSDAEPAVVQEVLETLPHVAADEPGDGVAPRVWRGMSRVGAWMNPFR